MTEIITVGQISQDVPVVITQVVHVVGMTLEVIVDRDDFEWTVLEHLATGPDQLLNVFRLQVLNLVSIEIPKHSNVGDFGVGVEVSVVSDLVARTGSAPPGRSCW